MSVASNAAAFSIQLEQKERYGLATAFDQVTLFHNAATADYQYYLEPGPREQLQQVPPISQDWLLYSVKKGDSLFGIAQQFGKTVAELKAWNELKEALIFTGQQLLIKQDPPNAADSQKVNFQKDSDWTSRAILANPISNFSLKANQEKAGSNAQLFGVLLENTQQSGVLYNMLGVNGATFYHFNHAEHFFAQLSDLAPDLILVTLGTNEAIQSKFYPDQVRKEIQDLLANAKKYAPQAAVLLTINPEVLIRKSRPSPYTIEVRKMIMEEAQKAGAAWWDLYEIMGGSESVRDWRKADLAYLDFIHFTKKGYILQAELLYQAFLEAYYAGN
jgi:LysM repeat protein